MTRRRVARAALALLALGAGLLASPGPSGAATVSKSAWWTRATSPASLTPPAADVPGVVVPDSPAPPPPPPHAPEGNLLVEGTPGGATAVAAVTYLLGDTESSPMLTITPDEGSQVPSDAVILACRAAIDWAAPESSPGAWADKPLVDCGLSVNGIVAEDGTITFALAPLTSGIDLDVVLVPGTVGQSTPAGPVGSSFSLTFSATEGAVLATTKAVSTSSGSSSTPLQSSAPAGSASLTPSFTAPSTAIVAPSLEPQDQAPTVPSQPALAAPAAAAADDKTAQGVGFIVLLAGLALAGWAYLTPARAEEGMVGLGRFRRAAPQHALATPVEPVNGGLGRFARPRTGPPPALS